MDQSNLPPDDGLVVQTLGYAPGRVNSATWRQWWRRWKWWGMALGFMGVGLLAIWPVSTRGNYSLSCKRCGAHRTGRFIDPGMIGWHWKYGERTSEGPVCKMVQARLGGSCLHQWELITRSGTRGLTGFCAIGGGGGSSTIVSALEHIPGAAEKIADTPGLIEEITQFVQTGDMSSPAFEGLLERLSRTTP